MSGTITRGYTFGATEEVTAAKLHALIDDGTISGITADDIASGTITDDKISSVGGSKFVNLANIPSGAGVIPSANLPSQSSTIIGTIYPVGSIYISTLSTNPATLLGVGVWASFGAGSVLVGLNSGDADFNTSEKTGGSKTVSTPAHIHTLDVENKGGDVSDGVQSDGTYMWNEGGDTYYSNTVKITTVSGGSGNVSVVQPYITVYMWKRIS